MRNKRIRRTALLALCLLLPLCGCWDSVEVDDQCYLLFLAVDRTEKGGVQLTTEVPSLSVEGELSKASPEENMVSVAGRNIFDAIDYLYAGLPLSVNISQLKAVILSEEVAQDENFIDILDDLLSLRGIRRMASVVVCEGRASDFALNIRPSGEMQLSKSMEIAASAYESSSYLINTRMLHLSMQMHQLHGTGITTRGIVSSPYSQAEVLDYYGGEATQPGDFYAEDIPHRGVTTTELFGTAIFNRRRMVMKLTGYETQLLSFLRGIGKYNLITLNPGDVAGEEIEQTNIILRAETSPTLSLDEREGRYVFSIELPLLATLTRSAGEGQAQHDAMEAAIRDVLQRDTQALLDKFQQAGLDPAELSSLMARRFATLQEWYAFDWDSAYREADIELNVSVYLQWPSQEPGGLPMYFR